MSLRRPVGAASSATEVTSRPVRFGRVLGRVADGGRGQDELGFGAVDGGHAAQTAQHVGDVAAEDPAVDVGLVDDDVAQVEEQVGPALVVGQEAHVEHVGVGQQQAPPLAGHASRRRGRVAVVDGQLDLAARHGAQPADLVLGERLGGVEVEGAGVGLGQQSVEHGQVEAHALARGGAGGDDEVLAALGHVPGRPLVQPERAHALSAESLGEQGVEAGRQGRRAAFVGRAHDVGFDLLEALRRSGCRRGVVSRQAVGRVAPRASLTQTVTIARPTVPRATEAGAVDHGSTLPLGMHATSVIEEGIMRADVVGLRGGRSSWYNQRHAVPGSGWSLY